MILYGPAASHKFNNFNLEFLQKNITIKNIPNNHGTNGTSSGVTLYQGAPGSKFSKAPLVEVLKARVEHRICTSFLGGPGHVHPENF